MEQNKINLLSARKQTELKKVIENAIAAGVQYNVNYHKFEIFKVSIDNEEKRNALIFLLDEMIDLVELDFRMAPIIKNLGDPAVKESLNYREFKLLQEVIKGTHIKGRNNLIKLCNSMEAFNEDGKRCDDMEKESKILATEYQKASTTYAQTCNKFGIMPDDLQDEIEQKTKETLDELVKATHK